jgi:hypothetical protein
MSTDNQINPSNISFSLQEKIAALESTLLGQHPQMPFLLKEIRLMLKKQPENVTLLEETQIRIIVNGLEKQTGTFLAESSSKTSKKPAAVTKLKALGTSAF